MQPAAQEVAMQLSSDSQIVVNEKLLISQTKVALRSLDKELTKEYRQAVENVPDLVLSETSMIKFLRTENMNPVSAARRLALNWKTRRAIYGKDRWLYPMAQTGFGTLCTQDVEILRSGYLSVFPSTNFGQVWIYDWSKLPTGATMGQPACTFYMFNTMSDIVAQTQGATFLIIASSRRQPLPHPAGDPLAKQIIESVPIRSLNVFIGNVFELGKERLVEYMSYVNRRVSETNTPANPREVRADSFASTLGQLQRLGFDRDCLTTEFGGHIDSSRFTDWVRMRISVENIMSSSPIALKGGLVRAGHGPSNRSGNRDVEQPVVQRLPGETRDEFERRRNRLYAKRSYERRRLATVNLHDQLSSWGLKNSQLREENDRLAKLLAKAVELVEDHVERSGPAVLALTTQKKEWESRNAEIREDNRRPEGLLADAHKAAEASLPSIPFDTTD